METNDYIAEKQRIEKEIEHLQSKYALDEHFSKDEEALKAFPDFPKKENKSRDTSDNGNTSPLQGEDSGSIPECIHKENKSLNEKIDKTFSKWTGGYVPSKAKKFNKAIKEDIKEKLQEFLDELDKNMLDFDLSKKEDLFIIGYNACLRDVFDKIDKLALKKFGGKILK